MLAALRRDFPQWEIEPVDWRPAWVATATMARQTRVLAAHSLGELRTTLEKAMAEG